MIKSLNIQGIIQFFQDMVIIARFMEFSRAHLRDACTSFAARCNQIFPSFLRLLMYSLYTTNIRQIYTKRAGKYLPSYKRSDNRLCLKRSKCSCTKCSSLLLFTSNLMKADPDSLLGVLWREASVYFVAIGKTYLMQFYSNVKCFLFSVQHKFYIFSQP